MEQEITRFRSDEPYFFTKEEKRAIIIEYLNSHYSKCYIWEKYTGRKEEKGALLNWMRELGFSDSAIPRRPRYVPRESYMDKSEGKEPIVVKSAQQLEMENALLRKQLEEAKLKVEAYSTLIDVAEEMFKIPIRKKPNTKP